MKRPSVRPLLRAALGLMLCAGSTRAAGSPTTEPPPPASKPGWVSRVAAGSRKLAFWDKDKFEAAPARASAPKPEAASAGPSKERGAPASATPPAPAQRRAAKKTAAAPPPAPPEPAPEKKSLFSRLPPLPPLPFLGKAEPPPAPDPVPEPATPRKKGQAARVAAVSEAKPAAGAGGATDASEPKKPGIFELGRLWPGARKAEPAEAPSTVADGTPSLGGIRRPSSPAGQPEPVPASPEAVAAGKPSWWARMAAAVTPGGPDAAKPPITPVARGLVPLGVAVPDSRTFVITKDDSPFFSFGPQQTTPPDAYLSTGTVVTLTGKNWGWANVQLPDGRVGVIDRAALRPALVSDLIPSQRPGDPLMASLSPNQLKPKSSANFALPAAEMPDLPTSGDTGAMAGNPLLLPFSPDDITEPGQLPPLPEIQPLPEPAPPADPELPAPAPSPTPEPAAPGEAKPAPEPAEPAAPAE